MSRKDKPCLKMQAKARFDALRCFGRSKHEDKVLAGREYDRLVNPTMSRQEYINEAIRDKIYSVNSYKTYAKHNNYFFRFCEEKYQCKTLEECHEHINEWLQSRVDAGLSASTIDTEKSGLGKLYQEPSTNYLKTPSRAREDITRSRGYAERDRGFSLKNNAEIINFARGTGLRAFELAKVKGTDLKAVNGEYTLTVRGKGGKWRDVPVVGPHKQDIVNRCLNAGDGRVWASVPSHMDTHGYRSDYATAIYTAYARPLEELKGETFYNSKTGKMESAVYYCRGDRKGDWFDKQAMLKASEALGHSRIDVVAAHYLR